MTGSARRPKASRTPKDAGWEHYFPFARGRDFEVELVSPPLPLRGRGSVVKRTATAIHLRLELPGGFLVPPISADVELTYSGEGGGNSGRLEVQVGKRRETFEDGDVSIHSAPGRRSREIAPSVAPSGGKRRAVLQASAGGECRLSAPGFEIKLVAR